MTPKVIVYAILGTKNVPLTVEDISADSTGWFGGWPIGVCGGGIFVMSVVKRRCRFPRASLDDCECVVMKLPL